MPLTPATPRLFTHFRASGLLTAAVWLLATSGCRQPPAQPAPIPAAKPVSASPAPQGADADVAATIEQVLSTSEHPSLKWSRIPDVVSVLQPLYASEPDRLYW